MPQALIRHPHNRERILLPASEVLHARARDETRSEDDDAFELREFEAAVGAVDAFVLFEAGSRSV